MLVSTYQCEMCEPEVGYVCEACSMDRHIKDLEQENKLLREALDWATATQLRSSFNWEKSEKIRNQFKLDGEA